MLRGLTCFTVTSTCMLQLGWGRRGGMDGITVNSPTVQLADANSPTYKIE